MIFLGEIWLWKLKHEIFYALNTSMHTVTSDYKRTERNGRHYVNPSLGYMDIMGYSLCEDFLNASWSLCGALKEVLEEELNHYHCTSPYWATCQVPQCIALHCWINHFEPMNKWIYTYHISSSEPPYFMQVLLQPSSTHSWLKPHPPSNELAIVVALSQQLLVQTGKKASPLEMGAMQAKSTVFSTRSCIGGQ